MNLRIATLGLCAALLAWSATRAVAHPHVWITARAELVFNPDGKVAAVRHAWTFDKAYSAFVTQGLDTNKDGRISQAEAAVDSTVVFSSADTNGDGYLDNDEWKASEKGSSQPRSQSQSDSPDTSTPSSSAPPPPDSTRSPDTETPRQQ